MASIGCNNFHFAVMNTEETKTAAPTYDDTTGMTAIPNLVKIDVQPQTNSATAYGDNGPVLTATSLGEITVNVETVDIEPEILAKILGHTYDDKKKTIVYNANDVAPYVAIGFASQLNDGSKTKFVKLFKGKFQEPNDEPQTKGASIEFKNPTIAGKFVMLNNNKNWKLVQYADNDEVDTVATAFFKTVLPTA